MLIIPEPFALEGVFGAEHIAQVLYNSPCRHYQLIFSIGTLRNLSRVLFAYSSILRYLCRRKKRWKLIYAEYS